MIKKIDTSSMGEVLKSFKNTIDPDSVMYIFEESDPLCVSREYMYKTDDENKTFYQNVVQKYIYSNTLLKQLYKNNDGYWIDIDKLFLRNTSTQNIYDLANIEEYYKGYIIPRNAIPPCDFTDINGRIYPIIRGDGTGFDVKKTIFINEVDPNEIMISQCNIDSPSALGDTDHLKNDIKIEFKKFSCINDVLIWMNGVFVNYEKKTGEENILYIRDGKELLVTKPLSEEDNGNPIYYYFVDLRIFKWDNIGISPMIPTRFTKLSNLTSGRYVMGIVTEVYFEEEINEDAHLIFCNGQILSSNKYRIDPNNKKHIYLTSIKTECETLINEKKNEDEYLDDPFVLLAGLFKNKVYSLINFSEYDNKKIYLNRTKPLIKGFPTRFDMLFENPQPKDLITVNGFYYPFLLDRNWFIRYPIESHIFMTEYGDILKDCDITRIDFLCQKTIEDNDIKEMYSDILNKKNKE